MVTAALASHCRRAPDMGILDRTAFLDIVAQRGDCPPPMPAPQVPKLCHLLSSCRCFSLQSPVSSVDMCLGMSNR